MGGGLIQVCDATLFRYTQHFKTNCNKNDIVSYPVCEGQIIFPPIVMGHSVCNYIIYINEITKCVFFYILLPGYSTFYIFWATISNQCLIVLIG